MRLIGRLDCFLFYPFKDVWNETTHPLFLLIEILLMIKVLFICLGNICRSPMAEAIFSKMVEEAGLADKISVDSAGTSSWHVGEPAHSGTRSILKKNGISYIGRARRVQVNELKDESSYLIAMDRSNLGNIRTQNPDHPHMHLLLEFAEGTKENEVPDPYYHDNFDYVYQLVEAGCLGLLDYIRSCEKI